MVGPVHRRQAAHAVVARGLCSVRAACRILRLSRATFWYRAQPPTPAQERLAKRLRTLSEQHPRYGYRRIAALLRQEGWSVGKRHIQRLRRADGLRVPPTRRKIVRRGISTGLPTKAEGEQHQGGVVVEAAPGATFEVVEAQFLLHLLVALFDLPTLMPQAHRPEARGVGGQVASAVSG